jgi:hypothetical protein
MVLDIPWLCLWPILLQSHSTRFRPPSLIIKGVAKNLLFGFSDAEGGLFSQNGFRGIDLENQLKRFQRIAVGVADGRGLVEMVICLQVKPSDFHLPGFNRFRNSIRPSLKAGGMA